MDNFKVCKMCGENKPVKKFVIKLKARIKITYSQWCDVCRSKNRSKKNKEYRKNNKEKVQKAEKRYREENKERIETWRTNNKELIKTICKDWRSRNKEKIQQYERIGRPINNSQRRKYHKKGRDKLSDWYLKSLIFGKSTLTVKEIPQSLIELKRQQLILIRLIKEKM